MMLFPLFMQFFCFAVLSAALPFFSLLQPHPTRALEAAESLPVSSNPVVATTVEDDVLAPRGFCGSAPKVKSEPETVEPVKTTYTTSSAPMQTLAPSLHWTWDTKDLKNIEPVAPDADSKMYYGVSDPSEEGYFAFMTFRFAMPSVNLDHTDHAEAEYTDDGKLKIRFNNPSAFQRAVDHWDSDKTLLFISHLAGCALPGLQDHCYFHATDLEVSEIDETISASGTPAYPDKLMNGAETEWGRWIPRDPTDHHSSTNCSAGLNQSGACTTPSSNTSSFPNAMPNNRSLADARLGPSFDILLDEQSGYDKAKAGTKDFIYSAISTRERLATGENSTHCVSRSQAVQGRRRNLESRGFWSNLWNGIVKGVESIYNTVAEALSIRGDFSKPLAWDFPSAEVPRTVSEWSDNSILLFKDERQLDFGETTEHVHIYCVDCGVSGQALLSGKAKITPLLGIFDAELAVAANMKIVLKVGIDAEIKGSHSVEHELFTAGLPGLSYGIVTLGPYISVAAKAGIEAAASGKLLIGAEMGLAQAEAVLSVFEPSKSTADGWTPYFKPVVEAEGRLQLAAKASLPIRVKVGLKVASFEAAVGFTNEPLISAAVQASGSAKYTGNGVFETNMVEIDGCSGISAGINWGNRLTFDSTGFGEMVLFDTGSQPLLKSCLGSMREGAGGKDGARPATANALHALQNSASENGPHQLPNVTAHRQPPVSASVSRTALVNSSCEDSTDIEDRVFKDGHSLGQAPLLTKIGTGMVVSCSDGNMYVTAAGNQTTSQCTRHWATSDEGIVLFDGSLRIMHYYGAAMSVAGVSRLRSSPEHKMPKDAVPVILAPVRATDGSVFYMAADANHQVFYPVVCNFVGEETPRVFLAKTIGEGVEALQSQALVRSITGAPVEECFGLSLPPVF